MKITRIRDKHRQGELGGWSVIPEQKHNGVRVKSIQQKVDATE